MSQTPMTRTSDVRIRWEGKELERALAKHIPTRRWFRTKSLSVHNARITHAFPFAGGRICIVDVELEGGRVESYVVPLVVLAAAEAKKLPEMVVMPVEGGFIADATSSEVFLAALLEAVEQGATLREGDAVLAFHPLAISPEHVGLPARLVNREQTNTSILYGDQLVGKLVRKLDMGASPDLELGRFLTGAGYANAPAVAGWVDLVRGNGEPATVGLFHRFVANQGDAWEHALRELRAGNTEYPALARRLGERVGEMHVALAQIAPAALDVTPVTTRAAADLDRVLAMLESKPLAPSAQRLAAEIVSRKAELHARLAAAASLRDRGAATRVHGDLHLGQVLFTGDDFVIIDFEGEPARTLEERKEKRSPLVDVAGMLRSFEYAAATAKNEDLARAAADEFLAGYTEAIGDTPILPVHQGDRRALLDLFVLEKCIYEVRYELDNRPDWVEIPLRGLSALLGPRMVDPISPALDAFSLGHATHAHALFGAHPVADGGGTRFVVMAGQATQVEIVSDVDGWIAHPLVKTGATFAGVVSNIQPGHRYKLRIDGHEKADPFGSAHDGVASIVVVNPTHAWKDASWTKKQKVDGKGPLSIYEVHLGSFMKRTEEGNPLLNYRELARPLAEHARKLGFTHVELMPLMEHPYFGSWGYGVTGFFSPTSRYGTAEDLMFLVDTLHEHGIGVIFDWVPAHFAKDAHGLEGLGLDRGLHPTWGSYRFDFAKPEVRSFLLSSAFYWLETFHADGLRVDGVESILYADHGSKPEATEVDPSGVAFLKELTATLKREHPQAWLIAEDSSSFPGTTKELGFDLKWDMGFSHDMIRYLSHDPIERAAKHDALTFRSVYVDNEAWVTSLSHDDVAKASLSDQIHGDPWQRLANLRLLFAMTYAQPGKKLVFMGTEMNVPWHHEQSLAWGDADGRIMHMVGDLNRLHRDEPGLHGDQPGSYVWIDGSNREQSVVTFIRRNGDHDVICAFNFTPVPRHQYRIGVPRVARYDEIFDSDATIYGGSGQGNMGGVEAVPYPWNGQKASIVVTLPPLGAIFLRA